MCAASRRAASISSSRASGCASRKSEVSRIAGLLDEQVQAFRERPLEGRYPYLFVDAKVEKVRDGGRVARKCVVVAHAVHETGRREIIGLDVGAAETEAFWREFLRGLVARGLVGVAAGHLRRASGPEGGAGPGPRRAVAALHRALPTRPARPRPQGSARRARARSSARSSPPRTATQARRRLRDAVEQLERRLPKVAALLEEAEADVLAFYAFPAEHWPKLRSTNPLERFNREIAPAHRRRRHLPR